MNTGFKMPRDSDLVSFALDFPLHLLPLTNVELGPERLWMLSVRESIEPQKQSLTEPTRSPAVALWSSTGWGGVRACYRCRQGLWQIAPRALWDVSALLANAFSARVYRLSCRCASTHHRHRNPIRDEPPQLPVTEETQAGVV